MDEHKLAEFGRRMLEATKECIREGWFEYNAESMADEAVKLGLIDQVIYDPDTHVGVQDAEPGDRIYWWGEPNEQPTHSR